MFEAEFDLEVKEKKRIELIVGEIRALSFLFPCFFSHAVSD